MHDLDGAALPLTPAQLGLWLGHHRTLDPSIYNCGEETTVRGKLEPARFMCSLLAVLSAAPSLRAAFVDNSQGPELHFRSGAAPDIAFADLTGQADSRAVVQRWTTERLSAPFALERGALAAHRLFRLSPEEHVWVQTAHHIALDGFGFALLRARVFEHYRTGILRPFGNVQAVLAASDDYEQSAQRERDRAFFASRHPQYGAARLHRYRSATRDSAVPKLARPRRVGLMLGAASGEGLRRTAQAAGLHWTELGLGCAATFVGAVTGRRTFALGLPIMQRVGTEALDVPCMAMNIVGLPVTLTPGATALDVARGLRKQLQAQRQHQRFRYEHLQPEAGPPFGPIVNLLPLGGPVPPDGCVLTTTTLAAGPVEDLAIGLSEREHGFHLSIDAHPALYSEANLSLLLKDLVRHLTAAVGPAPARPREVSPLSSMLLAHTRTRPQQLALVSVADNVTYAQLLQYMTAFCAQLVAAQVSPGQLVALHAPRGNAGVISAVACVVAGYPYVALDPAQPKLRRESLLRQCRPAVVVGYGTASSPASAATLARPTGVAHLRMPADPAAWTRPGTEGEKPLTLAEREPDALAYVTYTSGSSGAPKGVAVHRAALEHFVIVARKRYAVNCSDRVLQFAGLSFDASVEEIFVTLYAGATLCIRDDAMLASMSAFGQRCADWAITVLDLPTAFFRELAWALGEGTLAFPKTVHTTVIGGEAVDERSASSFCSNAPGCRLLNTYGPSEVTVVATCAELDGATPTPPIGRPLAGVEFTVADALGQYGARPGTTGELLLFGPTVSRGYYLRDDLTEQRFAHLPECGGAWSYRTGDNVRVLADGQLLYLGRTDDEVKISGIRINPAEIEAALLSLPLVTDAAVVVVRAGAGASHLVAHVESASASEAELRRLLGERLLPAMIPQSVVVKARLPRGPNGKLDRRALREVVPMAPRPAACSKTEELVLQAFADVLGSTTLGLDDDFFGIGGHSLQAIQVANRLGAHFPQATTTLVFGAATPRALAAKLDGKRTPAEPDYREVLPLPAHHFSKAVTPPSGGSVLLTGATGLVGAHVLAELLNATERNVICLVRATDAGHAWRRLAETAKKYSLRLPPASRVTAIAAELREAELAARIPDGVAIIIHAAAQVSLSRSFASMREVNVDAVRALLCFAGQRGAAFHYLSTLAVAQRDGTPVPEQVIEAHGALRDGYQQTKWHAEQLCHQAQGLGLAASVYRLGRVTGATRHPTINPNDIVWRIARASIRCGARPALHVKETWTPADRVAHAIVALAVVKHSDQQSAFYNLANNGVVSHERLWDALGDAGCHLTALALPAWLTRVAATGDDEDQATVMLLKSHAAAPASAPMGPIGFANVARALGHEPPLSAALVRAYCRSALRVSAP